MFTSTKRNSQVLVCNLTRSLCRKAHHKVNARIVHVDEKKCIKKYMEDTTFFLGTNKKYVAIECLVSIYTSVNFLIE